MAVTWTKREQEDDSFVFVSVVVAVTISTRRGKRLSHLAGVSCLKMIFIRAYERMTTSVQSCITRLTGTSRRQGSGSANSCFLCSCMQNGKLWTLDIEDVNPAHSKLLMG